MKGRNTSSVYLGNTRCQRFGGPLKTSDMRRSGKWASGPSGERLATQVIIFSETENCQGNEKTGKLKAQIDE